MQNAFTDSIILEVIILKNRCNDKLLKPIYVKMHQLNKLSFVMTFLS